MSLLTVLQTKSDESSDGSRLSPYTTPTMIADGVHLTEEVGTSTERYRPRHPSLRARSVWSAPMQPQYTHTAGLYRR